MKLIKKMFEAIIQNDLSFIKKNINYVGVNQRNSGKLTLLMVACKNDCHEIVQFLIEKEANLNEKDENGETALHHGLAFCSKRSVEWLIKKGCDCNEKGPLKTTPLMKAIKSGNDREIIETLIEKSSGLDDKDKNGWTALMHAVHQKNFEAVQLLVVAGANIKASTKGETAKTMAQKRGLISIEDYLSSWEDRELLMDTMNETNESEARSPVKMKRL